MNILNSEKSPSFIAGVELESFSEQFEMPRKNFRGKILKDRDQIADSLTFEIMKKILERNGKPLLLQNLKETTLIVAKRIEPVIAISYNRSIDRVLSRHKNTFIFDPYTHLVSLATN